MYCDIIFHSCILIASFASVGTMHLQCSTGGMLGSLSTLEAYCLFCQISPDRCISSPLYSSILWSWKRGIAKAEACIIGVFSGYVLHCLTASWCLH